MRYPIRFQILIPFSGAVMLAVAVIALTSAWLAARRSERQALQQLNSVLQTLETMSLTYSPSILDKMHGLSGAEFASVSHDGKIIASTIPLEGSVADLALSAPLIREGRSFSEFPSIAAGDSSYFAARLRTDGVSNVTTLVILYPEDSWREVRWSAAWPPLLIGLITLPVMAVIAALLAQRISSRIQTVERLLGEIADGRSHDVPSPGTPADELDELVESAGRLSDQLLELQQTIRQTERVRLLSQLAGGLAHQLRNAVTGARLAIQLHQRRCDRDDDDSLDVALRQLTLTEEQVRGLLSLSHPREQPPEPASLDEILDEVVQLVFPGCRHARVGLTVERSSASGLIVPDGAAFRAALLNLTLNATEAAGQNGEVILRDLSSASQIKLEIHDDGNGPPEELKESLFDEFVTSKPEGVGLGLALARRAAESAGGTLSWERRDGWTVFCVSVPAIDQPSANDQKPPVPKTTIPDDVERVS